MDPAAKDELVARFGAFLEQLEELPGAPRDEDAFSLVAELAGLKAEIKRESRQVKEALDQFRSAFATLKADNDTLSRELDQRRTAEQSLRRETLRPLLLQIIELRDRLVAGLEASAPPRAGPLGWLYRRHSRRLAALREGQDMTLRRLDRLLAEYQVRPLEVLDKPLDPHTMRVVEVETRPGKAQGVVTGELRKGFLWDDTLLRLAEVKVNKFTGEAKADQP